MLRKYQWVTYEDKPALVLDVNDDGAIIRIIPNIIPEEHRISESELEVLELPEFEVGQTVIYTGHSRTDLDQNILVTITGHQNGDIQLYRIINKDIVKWVPPFELTSFDY